MLLLSAYLIGIAVAMVFIQIGMKLQHVYFYDEPTPQTYMTLFLSIVCFPIVVPVALLLGLFNLFRQFFVPDSDNIRQNKG